MGMGVGVGVAPTAAHFFGFSCSSSGPSSMARVSFVSCPLCIESFGNRHINFSQHNISIQIQIHSPFKANDLVGGFRMGVGVVRHGS